LRVAAHRALHEPARQLALEIVFGGEPALEAVGVAALEVEDLHGWEVGACQSSFQSPATTFWIQTAAARVLESRTLPSRHQPRNSSGVAVKTSRNSPSSRRAPRCSSPRANQMWI